MNKIFKTISNFKNGQRVVAVASELAQALGSKSSAGAVAKFTRKVSEWFKPRQMAALISLAFAALPTWALPLGGEVVNGNVTISTQGTAMTVQQAAGNATINWQNFNVATGESVNFNLANPNNITLNRIGGTSLVDGHVSSNGNLWFATGGNLFTVGSHGSISAMKEIFVTSQDMAVGQYTKPVGEANTGSVNVLPAGKLAAKLIHIDAGSVNMSHAQLIADSLDEGDGITVIGQRIAVTDSQLTSSKGDIVVGREAYGSGALAQSADVSGSTFLANNVETSAEVLSTSGVTVKANNWLLDPTNVTITASASTGGTLAGALGESATSNINATDLQNAINAGTSVNVVASGSITQSVPLIFNVTGTAQTPTLTLDNTSGSKQSISLSAITDNSTGSGSGVNLVAKSAGGGVPLNGAITVKGALTIDNTYQVGGLDSGYINASNITTLGQSTPLAIRNAISAGGDITLNYATLNVYMAGETSFGTTVSLWVGSALSSTNGSIRINNLAYMDAAHMTVQGGVWIGNTITANSGVVSIVANEYGGNGGTWSIWFLPGTAAAKISAQQISLIGYDSISPYGMTLGSAGLNVLTVVPGHTFTESDPYAIYVSETTNGVNNSTRSRGLWIRGDIVSQSNGGSISFNSNSFIESSGKIELAANTSGLESAVTFNTTTGDNLAYVSRNGVFSVATGSTQPVDFSIITKGAQITEGSAISVPGYINLDMTNGGTVAASAASASGITVSSVALSASNIGGATNGININGLNGVSLVTVPLTNGAGDINVTSYYAAAGSTTAITQTGAITQNGIGGDISFKSNNSISQSGAITMVANTTASPATLTYDTTAGNKSSTIVSGALTIASGSTSNINYVMKSAGSTLNTGVIGTTSSYLPGYVIVDNTYGGSTPTSGYINADNLSTYANTTVGLTIDSAIYADAGITLNGVSNGGNGISISQPVVASTGAISINGTSTTVYGVYSNSPITAVSDVVSIIGRSTTGQAIYMGASAGITGQAVNLTANGTTAATIATINALTVNDVYQGGTAQLGTIGIGSTGGTYIGDSAGLPTLSAAYLTAATPIAANVIYAMSGATSRTAYYLIGVAGTNKIIQIAVTNLNGETFATVVGAKTNNTNISLTGNQTNALGGTTNILDLWNGSTAGGIGTATVQTPTSTYNGAYGASNLSFTGQTFTHGQSGNLTVTANITAAGGNTGITQSGAIYQNANGGNITFTSNNKISQAGVITVAPNTSGASSSITYDTTSGTSASTISSGALTLTGGVSASDTAINYIEKTAGAAITTGAIGVPGYINLDMTNGGVVAASGSTTATGITVGGNLVASNLASAPNGINIAGLSTTGTAVTMGAYTLINGAGNINVSGFESAAGGATSITTTGAITQNADGGSITFTANNIINQTGAITVAANTTAASAVTYDTTRGNKSSTITAGALTVTLGSTKAVNYIEKAAGGAISTGGASVPGYITLDNTYGCTGTGCTPTSGYINISNGSTLATTAGTGVNVNGALTSGIYSGTSAITLNGVSHTAGSAGVYGSALITATSGDVNINGINTNTNNTLGFSTAWGAIANAGNINIAGYSAAVTAVGAGIAGWGVRLNGTNAGSSIPGTSVWLKASGNINVTGYSVTNNSVAGNTYGLYVLNSAIVAGGHVNLGGYGSGNGNQNSGAGALVISGSAISAAGRFTAQGAKIVSGQVVQDVGNFATGGGFGVSFAGNNTSYTTTGLGVGTYSGVTAGTGINVYGLMTGSNNMSGVNVSNTKLTATTGDIDIIGLSTGAPGQQYGLAVYGASAIKAVSGNVLMSGTTSAVGTVSGTLSNGLYFQGTSATAPAYVYASGNVSMAGITNATGAGTTQYGGVWSGTHGAVVFEAGNNITIAAQAPNNNYFAMYLANTALKAGNNITLEGASMQTYGSLPLQVAMDAPGTAASNPLYGIKLGTSGTNTYNGVSYSEVRAGGAVTLLGKATGASGNAIWDAGLNIYSGAGTTITGTGTTNLTVVNLAANITNTGDTNSNIIVTGNNAAAGSATGVYATGLITQNANGGDVKFISNNSINQTNTVSIEQNTSGADSIILYDTSTGNRTSTINGGAIAFNGTSTSYINYSNISSGAQLVVDSALNVPGSITFDNTYLNGVQGGITSANAWSLGTVAAGGGVPVTANLTAAHGIYIRGVVGAASSTAAQTTDAVSIYNATASSTLSLTTTGTFGSGQNAISIVGITPQHAAVTGTTAGNAVHIYGSGATANIAINNNSTGGNTSIIAYTGRYNDVVSINNASTAGAIELSAIGPSADIVTVSGTTFTQDSNEGIYIATSNNGNVLPPKIVNNGTGNVVVAAGAYLPVGNGTGGQIVGVSGNTLTSPNGNVYLYAGQPGTSYSDVTKLAYMVGSLGTLTFNNTVFSQAYHTGNVAATALTDTAINIGNLPTSVTTTGSSAGPAIQFRVQPSYQMVLAANLTKVYGTADPSNALNTVGTIGSLEYALAQNFTTPTTNSTRLRNNNGVTEIILNVNGSNFYIPLNNFLNSITGTRSGYGALAGEQVYTMPTSGSYNANYGYVFNSSMGILVTSGVLLNGAVGANPVGLSITPAPLTITSYGSNFTYDGVTKFGRLITTTGLVTSVDGVETGDSVTSISNTFRTGSTVGSGTVIDNPDTTVVNAGSYNGSPSGAVGTGLSNYNVVYVGAAFTVSPAPLSVVGASTSKVYTGTAQSNGTATITGLKGTEGITVTGYGSGTTVAGGPYADNLQVTWGTAQASNYTLTTTNGALTITGAPLTINASPVSTTYGTAQTLSASGNVVTTGLLGSDTVSGVGFTYNGNSTVPGTLSAGTYANALETSSATGTGLGNYNITYGSADLVVSKANLVISQPTQSLTYNGTLRGGTAASSLGTVSGNVVSTGINGDTFTVTGTASGTNVGAYSSSLLASGGNSANYNITYTNGTLNITPATLTITASSTTKVYDGTTTSGGTPTVSGLFGLDNVTGMSQSYASKNVLGSDGSTLAVNGGYTVNDGHGGSNYTVTVVTATGTITPRPLTVSGIAATAKVYDGTTDAAITTSGAQVSGVISGDAVTTTIGSVTGTFADANVGASKAVNLSGISLGGADAANYTLAGVGGVSAAISARPVVITGATTSNAYTAATQTNTYTVTGNGTTSSGVVAGESITATGSSSGLNVGTYNDSLEAVAGSGTSLSNYSISYVPGSLTITPVTLVAVATANNKVYDAGTATTGSIALSGLLGADAGTVGATGTFAFGQSNVGNGLTVSLSGVSLTGAASGNYVLPSIAAPTANITPAPLTVQINDDGKLYSLSDSSGYNGYTLSGFVAGQTSSVLPSAVMNTISLTRDTSVTVSGGTENAGTYVGAIKASVNGNTPSGTVAAGNYALSFVPGTFSIAPPGSALIKVGSNSTDVYGNEMTALVPTVSYITGSTVVNLTQVSANTSNGVTAYTFTDSVNGSVAFSLSTNGLASSTAGKVKVGTYALNTLISAISVTPGSGLTSTSVSSAGSYTVTPAVASITANATNVVYNGLTQNQTATTSGILANDKVAYTGLASGKNVAVYSSNLAVTNNSNASSADSGNYTFTLVNNNLTITPYQLQINGGGSTASPGITATANNRQYDGTTVATGTLTPVLFAGDTLTATGAATFDTKHVGTGKTVTFGSITLAGSAETLANYSLPSSGNLTATANVTPAPLSITGLAVNSKQYDGTLTAALNSSGASVSGVMRGDSISVNASGATGTFASKNVGNGIAVSVTNAANALTASSGTDLGDYTLSSVTGLTANISQAPLIISGLVAANKVYDGGTAAALTAPNTATISGVVSGDTITLNASGASGVFADKNVGTGIAVSATLAGNLVTVGSGTLLSNYTLGSATVSAANITPAPLTVSGVTAVNKVYDGTTSAVLSTSSAGLSGAVAGEALTLDTSGAGGTFNSKNAGTAVPVTVTGIAVTASGGALLSNYTLAQPSGVSANITPKPLTVTGLVANNKVYDATTVATLDTSGASVSGVVPGELISLTLTGALGSFVDKNVANGIAVTVSGVSSTLTAGTGTLLSNYSLNSVGNLSANITPAPLTITGMTASNKAYNGSFFATLSGGTLAGIQGSDSITLDTSGATGVFASKNAGNGISVAVTGNTVTASVGTMLSNYTFSEPTNITANITPKALSVLGVTAADKVYDGNTLAVVDATFATLSGLVPGESFTLDTNSALGNFASKNASSTSQAVTITGVSLVQGSNSLASNYTLNAISGGSALITPAPLTVTGLVALNKVYDRTTIAQLDTTNAQVTGVIQGDSVSLAAGSATGIFADRNVDNAIPVSVPNASNALVPGSGTLLSNYSLIEITGLSANITPKPITATGVTVANKVYDGTGTATVTPGTGTLLGVLTGDLISLDTSAAYGTFASVNAGNGIAVAVTGAGLTATNATLTSNYVLSQPAGVSANITPATLVVTGAITSIAYNGTTQSNAGANVSGGLVSGETITISGYGAGKNVGTYADNLVATAGANTQLSNYSISYVNGSLTVTPYQLNFGSGVTGPQITASVNSKVYDASTAAAGALTVAHLFGEDVLTASASTFQFDSADVGTAKTVTLGGITLTGSAQTLANYSLSGLPVVTASANVLPAPLTVYVQNDAKFVTQTDAVGASGAPEGYNGFEISGFVGSESVSVLNSPAITVSRNGISIPTTLGAAGVEDTGTYPNALSASGPSTVGNYSLTYVPGTFTILPAGQLLVRTTGATGVYASGSVTPVITSVSYMDATSGNTISSLSFASSDGDRFTYSDGVGETVSFSLTPIGASNSRSGNINVGSYALEVSGLIQSGTNLSNVAQGVATGNLQITPKTATITATTTSTVYTGGAQTQSVVTTNFEATDDVAIAGMATGTNVGSYGSMLSISGPDADNYSFVLTNGALTVTPAQAIVAAIPVTVYFNGTAQNQSATVTGFLDSGDPITGLGVSGLVSQTNVGSYQSALVATNSNYIVTLLDAPFEIVPNTISVPTAPNAPNVNPPALPHSNGGGVKPAIIDPGIPSFPATVPAVNGGVSDSSLGHAERAESNLVSGHELGASRITHGRIENGLQEGNEVRNYDLIGFSSGSDTLSSEFKELMSSLSERKVVITGYADKEEENPMEVSLRRAQMAKNFLIGKGWNSINITVKAVGATDQFDKQRLAPNRRVYIHGDWPVN